MTARRRLTAAVSLAALVAGLIGTGAAFAQDEDIRVRAEGVQGYSLASDAAPASVEFFASFIPIPTDPGEPQFQITESHTQARVDVGPTSRGLASSVWPGPAVGDGFHTVCACDESYPIKADARYPGETNRSSQTLPSGGGMTAAALGIDAFATAESATSPGPELMDFGNVASASETHVLDGRSVATVDASASDLSLLAGLITIDSVRTTLESVSDTETATTSGTTEVNGLAILGQGYTVDQDGLHPVEQDEGGDGEDEGGDGENEGGEEEEGGDLGEVTGDVTDAVPDAVAVLRDVLGSEELRDEFGISAKVVDHEEEISGSNGRRHAQGLRIIVETAPLRSALEPLPLNEVVEQVPDDDVKAELFFLLGLSPRIDFVFAEGTVTAAATPPISVGSPAPSATSTDAPAGTSTGSATGDTGSVSGGGVAAPPSTGQGQAPAVAPPSTATQPPQELVQAGAQLPELWDGVPPALLMLALGLTLGGGYGLLGLSNSAMTGTATARAGEQCALTNTRLHDLRA